MDDASRYITGYGIFSNAAGANAAGVREAAAKRGKPAAVLADRGARFCAESEGKKCGAAEARP